MTQRRSLELGVTVVTEETDEYTTSDIDEGYVTALLMHAGVAAEPKQA